MYLQHNGGKIILLFMMSHKEISKNRGEGRARSYTIYLVLERPFK